MANLLVLSKTFFLRKCAAVNVPEFENNNVYCLFSADC
jgi:hypothetical protein